MMRIEYLKRCSPTFNNLFIVPTFYNVVARRQHLLAHSLHRTFKLHSDGHGLPTLPVTTETDKAKSSKARYNEERETRPSNTLKFAHKQRNNIIVWFSIYSLHIFCLL